MIQICLLCIVAVSLPVAYKWVTGSVHKELIKKDPEIGEFVKKFFDAGMQSTFGKK